MIEHYSKIVENFSKMNERCRKWPSSVSENDSALYQMTELTKITEHHRKLVEFTVAKWLTRLQND
jgi:hypothetical protein